MVERSRMDLDVDDVAVERGRVGVDVDADDASGGACEDCADRVALPCAPATSWRTVEDSGLDYATVEGGEERGRGRGDSMIWRKPMGCQPYDDTWMVVEESEAIAVDYHRTLRATLGACARTKRTTYGSDRMGELALRSATKMKAIRSWYCV